MPQVFLLGGCFCADCLDPGDRGRVSAFIRVFCSVGFEAFASADDVELSFFEVFSAEG